MKSVLRLYIRETLIQERVGRHTFGFNTLRPEYGVGDKTTDIPGVIADYMAVGGSDLFSWLQNQAKVFGTNAVGDISSVLNTLKDSISSGIGNIGWQNLAGGFAASVAGAGLIKSLTDYLNVNASTVDEASGIVTSFKDYFNNLFNVIDDTEIVENFLLKTKYKDFDTAWPQIEKHYNDLFNRLLSSSDYDDFFLKLNLSAVKDSLDALIKTYKIKDDDSAYKTLAYAVLIHDTATTFLPKAIIQDISAYNDKMSPDQHEKVKNYLEALDQMLLKNTKFAKIQRDFAALSKNN